MSDAGVSGHCPRGHARTEENTYTYPNGKRQCRICMYEANRRYAKSEKGRKARSVAVRRYHATDAGRSVRNAAQGRYQTSEKGRATTARHVKSGNAAKGKRSWRATNPDRAAEEIHRRRTLMHKAAVGDIRQNREYANVLRSDPCSYCGASVEHLDHILALADGGSHEWLNLTGACARCNASKGSKRLLFWLQRSGS